MEERKEAASFLEGSERLSWSSSLPILPVFVACTTPTLSISPSLIVSHTRLLSFNVIFFLSPSHVPSSPSLLPPFFLSFFLPPYVTSLDFPLLFCLRVFLLFHFNFHLTSPFFFSPAPSLSVFQIYPLLFSVLILPCLLPGVNLSIFLFLSLLLLCRGARLARTNFRLITAITSINERGLSS